MFDSVQVVLFFVIIILTVLLVILGFQVFFILQEVRRTIHKANKVLDEAGTLAQQVSGPLSTISNLSNTLQAGSFIAVIKLIKSFIGNDKSDDQQRKDTQS